MVYIGVYHGAFSKNVFMLCFVAMVFACLVTGVVHAVQIHVHPTDTNI